MGIDAQRPAHALMETHRQQVRADPSILEEGRVDVRALGGLESVQGHVHAEQARGLRVDPEHHLILRGLSESGLHRGQQAPVVAPAFTRVGDAHDFGRPRLDETRSEMEHAKGVVGHRRGADLDRVGFALAVVPDCDGVRRAHHLLAAERTFVMDRVEAITRPVALLRSDPEAGVADDRLDALDQPVPVAIGGQVDVARVLADVAAMGCHAGIEDLRGGEAIVKLQPGARLRKRGAGRQQCGHDGEQKAQVSQHHSFPDRHGRPPA